MTRVMRAVVLGVVALVSVACTQVNEGERAVSKTWGKMDQECYTPGLYFYNPISTNMDAVDVKVQKFEAEKLGAATSDTQEIHANIVVTFSTDPSACHKLIAEIGHDYADKIVAPAVQDALKAGTAHFTLATIIKDREKLRAIIKDDLSARLKPSYIRVADVNLTNFDVSKAFSASVEAKQIAEQNVITAQRDAEAVQAKAKGAADATREAAKGAADAKRLESQAFADSLRIEAEARAQYNRKVAESLTPVLLQNRAIDAWRDGGSQVPQIVTGTGGVLIQVPMPTPKARE